MAAETGTETITTAEVQAPRVNDRRVGEEGERCRFTSRILPPYMRRSPKVAEVLPVLYLRGLSTGDFRPALEGPYESAEGGYIWIWGGPYDAREKLDGEFSDVIPENIIDELATELERDCVEWAPAPSPGDYDQSLFEDIARITEYCRTFSNAILARISHRWYGRRPYLVA